MLVLASVIAPLLATQVAQVAALPHRAWQSDSTDVAAALNADVTTAPRPVHWRPRPGHHHNNDDDEDDEDDSGDNNDDSGDNNDDSGDNDDEDDESSTPVPSSTGGDEDDESSSTSVPATTPTQSSSTEPETETETETEVPAPSSTATPTETAAPEPSTPATTTTAPGSVAAVTNLPANAKFDYQIGSPYTPASDVKVVSRDNSASPVAGLYNICYINAFQTQPDAESFWKSSHDSLLLRTKAGGYFEDADWPGEFFLDTSTEAKRTELATIVNGWIDDCASKGFQAIEPDNLDTYTRSNGLLTKDNNLAFAKLFTDYAHSKGLAVAQKNTGDLGSAGKSTAGFDFAIAEECQAWEECDTYTDVYGDKVVEIEYTDNDNAQSVYQTACKNQGSSISVIFRDRNVVASTANAYHYEEC